MSAPSLFRQQAIDYQRCRLYGDVLAKPSLPVILSSLVLLGIISVALLWICNASYRKTTTVAGWLEPIDGYSHIYAPRNGGIVNRLLVAQGDVVEKGQPLVELQFATQISDHEYLHEALTKEHNQQVASLQAQLDNLERTYEREFTHLQLSLRTAQHDKLQLNDIIKLQRAQSAIAQQKLAQQKILLTEGVITEHEWQQANLMQLQASENVKQLERELSSLELNIASFKQQLALSPMELDSRQNELQQTISRVKQQQIQAMGNVSQIISAPYSGRVSSIQLSVGMAIQSHIPLLTIVPEQSRLQAKLAVPVSRAAFLTQDLPVTLRYDAFPYEHYGTHQATISKVSQTPLLPNELSNSPIAIKDAVFLLNAQISQNHDAFPSEPRAGMTFQADILLQQQSLLEWLLAPLYRIGGRD